jgi:uncharacterized protein (DUF58 family)
MSNREAIASQRGAIAIRSAPPSAWQQFVARWNRWWVPYRGQSITREGKYFIGITLGVGFAAINTGNNLLYLLLGMLLSLIIASLVMSQSTLRGLTVTRQPPSSIFAQRPFLMGIGLKNGKVRLPSFSIEVEDIVGERPLDKKCYFLKLPAGRLQHTSYRHTFPRRGRYTFTAFRISTKFPFALFRKARWVSETSEVIVYPAMSPLGRPPPPRAWSHGEDSRGQKGRRGEFHGLHEYRDGDDPRDIHWRSTARKGRPMVREYEDEAARRVTLFLDNGLPDGERCTDELAKDGLERAISVTASLAADFLERGYLVRVVTRGEAPMPWLQGPQQLVRLLRALALLPAVPEETPFSSTEGSLDPILVLRRGGRRGAFGRVIEA